MVEEKSKAINSTGCVNSHWWVQIGSDHDEPLGQTRSGLLLSLSGLLIHWKFYDSLEDITSDWRNVNQFQLQGYNNTAKTWNVTVGLNYPNHLLCETVGEPRLNKPYKKAGSLKCS